MRGRHGQGAGRPAGATCSSRRTRCTEASPRSRGLRRLHLFFPTRCVHVTYLRRFRFAFYRPTVTRQPARRTETVPTGERDCAGCQASPPSRRRVRRWTDMERGASAAGTAFIPIGQFTPTVFAGLANAPRGAASARCPRLEALGSCCLVVAATGALCANGATARSRQTSQHAH